MRPIQKGHGQGAARSHSSQALGGSPQRRSTERDESTGHGVGYAIQETDRCTESLQMEGMTQCTWWPATTGYQLLGKLCSSRNVADHRLLLHVGNHQRVVELTNRFHIGIYTRPRLSPTLHETAPRYDSKFLPEGAMKGSHVLKLLCNIYGNKVAGHI